MAEEKVKKNFFKSLGASCVSWFKGTKAEFKKIIWPTPKKIVKDTTIVIVTVIIVGAFISLLNWIFMNGINVLFERG